MMSPWLIQVKWRRPIRCKKAIVVLLTIILCISLITNEILHPLHNTPKRLRSPPVRHVVMKQESLSEYIVDTPGCKIPNINPFDPTVTRFIRPLPPIQCTNYTVPLTYTDGVYVRINRTALRINYNTDLQYCQYQQLYRAKENSDNVFKFNKTIVEFSTDILIDCDFIRLACYNTHMDMIYSNFHAFIQTTNRKPHKAVFKTTNNVKTPSVLMIGLDSVSRLNFIRQMPESRQFLLDTLGAVELQGYNKVADNTLVNLAPMLAGQYLKDLPWDETQDWVPFDAYDFIWKDFKQQGYTTLFAEDAPEIAIFNYMKEGFHKAPVDYYFRPFSLAIENHGNLWNNNHDCFRELPEAKIVLNWAKEFMTAYREHPYFAFLFLTRLTHEDVNKAGSADLLYKKYIEDLYGEGLLNDTVLVFFSDHGIRFGPIRQTHVGKLEERLPFFYIVLPENFKKLYQSKVNNMIVNQNRLTTPFDVYETLLEILHPESPPKRLISRKRYGQSLFSVISEDRKCDTAGIEPHWCACHQSTEVNILDKVIVKGALFVVDYINDKLQIVSEYCEYLSLHAIQDALFIWNSNSTNNVHMQHSSNGIHNNNKEPIQDYLISLVVSPSGAIFEVTLRHVLSSDSYVVLGGPSRINSYGDGGKCVKQHSLQMFCHCREMMEY